MIITKIKNIKPFLLVIFFFTFLVSCGKIKEVKHWSNVTDIKEFERIMDTIFPKIESLLKKNGQFPNIVLKMNKNDNISFIKTLTDEIKDELRVGGKKGDYKAFAIFSNAILVAPNTKKDIDAIMVHLENNSIAYRFYFPYILAPDGILKFEQSWKVDTEKEVFRD